MRAIVLVALVAFLVCGASVAFAQNYLPWQTQGQVSPDRVLAERTRLSIVPVEAYAPYTPRARYAFNVVTEQVPPERALESRLSAGTRHLEDYMPFTVQARWAPWCFCEQIPPDRVLAERAACGLCSL